MSRKAPLGGCRSLSEPAAHWINIVAGTKLDKSNLKEYPAALRYPCWAFGAYSFEPHARHVRNFTCYALLTFTLCLWGGPHSFDRYLRILDKMLLSARSGILAYTETQCSKCKQVPGWINLVVLFNCECMWKLTLLKLILVRHFTIPALQQLHIML